MTATTATEAEPALTIHGKTPKDCQFLLSDEAVAFIASLVEKFGTRREALLQKRAVRQLEFDKGKLPDFNPKTKDIREGDWTVAPIPADLQDRRVEITGPAEPKMIINALNSGAKVFMADLEDSLAPTWEKIIDGQRALFEAVRGTLTFTSDEGKEYKLNKKDLATLIVRPRGWHLPERNVTYQGEPISGALFDFGMYFFHNAKERIKRGTGPYYYLPKTESAEEAQLWADVFAFSEEQLGVAKGSIKATSLIEVITATFEMHEILHALKDYAAGLNCGRWDYIFSFIKKFHARKEFILPDRSQIGMGTHFLKSYSELLIKTCHKRRCHAMGGMAAFIPVKNDEAANDKAFAAVKADKEREASNGHDGTWVAHPGLIPVAMEVFNRLMPTPNQYGKTRDDVHVAAKDLLTVPQGTITDAGLRNNLNVAIQYTANWLAGNGCVPLFNLMEDAATAEIARSQLWQWLHHGAKLQSGDKVSEDMLLTSADEEMKKIEQSVGPDMFRNLPYRRAKELVLNMTLDEHYTEFLTLPAYDALAS
jgi:malate synthase